MTETGRTVRDEVLAFLRAAGVTTVFGNPGSTELPLFSDWPDDFRYVMALHEASAVGMADGYAQATGRAAVVNLHSAAGVGNAMGAIFTAARNNSPVVVTAGQQNREMLPHDPFLFAESPTELPRPYVKWAVEPARAQDVPAAIARAQWLALQPPMGPTFVSIPMDDWTVPAAPVPHRELSGRFTADEQALAHLAEALAAARRPALIAGPGVDRDGAWEAVIALAERLSAVVWMSPHPSRAGFPEDHALFQGTLPPVRARVRERLAGHDVVVVLGAPVFLYHVPGTGAYLPAGTRLFQLSDDPDVLVSAPVGTAIRSHIDPAVRSVLARLGAGTPRAPRPGRGRIDPPRPSVPMTAEYVMYALGRALPADAVIVEEAPTAADARCAHLPVRTPGSFFATGSGCLGFALPAAVGVGLADPERRVVALVGDGSVHYTIQALWTAARYDVPLVTIVLDNGGYAALKGLAITLGAGKLPSFDMPGIDVCAIARGYGCRAERVTEPEQLVKALHGALAADRPTVIQIPVDDEVTAVYS